MNWRDRLDNIELEIITGDGRSFKPLWRDAKKNIRYNTEGHDFVGVEGTYVNREKQSGSQFPILLYFQGEDCIEEARRFEFSARDPRPWVIHHPFYDAILVQPLSLEIDNSAYNVSKITGIVWETINYKYPLEKLNVKITIIQIKSEIDARSPEVFESKITPASASSIEPAGLSVDIIEADYDILTDVLEDVEVLKDLARQASAAAQNLLSSPVTYMQKVQNLVNFPLSIQQTIEFKINKIQESFDNLKDLFIDGDEDEEKYQMFEALSYTNLSAACQISSTPESDDYATRLEVFNVIEQLSDLWDTITETFDDIEYEPDALLYFETDNIINNTVANLYDIAFDSKQERAIILEKDDNIINLAYRFYGAGDDVLENFINENSLSSEELTQIKKGRRLIWYV